MSNVQASSALLSVENGVVRLGYDRSTESYSIGLATNIGYEWKYISKELYNLLVVELIARKGFGKYSLESESE